MISPPTETATPVRLRLTVELDVEVADAHAIHTAALARGGGPETGVELAHALAFLLTPGVMLEEVPGARMGEDLCEITVEQLDDERELLDFAALFPRPQGLEDPETWWLTPRTAALLHEQLAVLADEAHAEIEENGDTPVDGADDDAWYVYARLPRSTFTYDIDWRRRFAECLDRLADDLAGGKPPTPTCAAEALCVRLALQNAATILAEEPDTLAELTAHLPVHDHDFDLEAVAETVFGDGVTSPAPGDNTDAANEPQAEHVRSTGVDSLPSERWFAPKAG